MKNNNVIVKGTARVLQTCLVIREVKIDVYGRPVTANAKFQVGFSGEVLVVRG